LDLITKTNLPDEDCERLSLRIQRALYFEFPRDGPTPL